MKNRKKILSVLTAAIMLLSATPVMAGGSSSPTVSLTSPTATSIPSITTAAAFNLNQTISPNSNLQFNLVFGGINSIYGVDNNNIKFYKATDTSASAIALTIAGTSSDTNGAYAVKDATVTATVASSKLAAGTNYVLYLSKAGIGNSTKTNLLAKDVYYYLTTDDGTVPYWPNGSALTATQTNNDINLSWNAASDNINVSNYLVYQNGTQIATTSALTYKATGLSAGSSYTFMIKAQDADSQTSAGLSTTATVNYFTPVFLGKTSGIDTNASLNVGFADAVAATSFAAITDKAVLTSSGGAIIPASVSLINSNKVIHVDPNSVLSYGTSYTLTLSDQIARSDGSLISGTRAFSFRTIDFAAPTVSVVSNATSAAAVTLTAGQSYTITAGLTNTQSSAVSGSVILVVRSGKGTILEYGGDSALQTPQAVTVQAGGTASASFTYTVPDDDSDTIYIDCYTINPGTDVTMSAQVHSEYSVE